MKKTTALLLIMLSMVLIVFGQDPDTVVIAEPGGFSGFYSKYSGAIWTILGLLGVTGFLTYRAGKVQAALNEIIKAAQDGHVTEAEFQAIVTAIKAIWVKKS